MPVSKGDRITLSIAPTIQLEQYKYVKPSASITRDLVSEDTEAELAAMADDLRKLIARSILTELGLSSDLYEALGPKSDVDSLAAFCQKELRHGPQGQDQGTLTVAGKGDPAAQVERAGKKGASAQGAGSGPVRRGPVKRT